MYRAQVMIYSIYFSENELILSISFFQYMTIVFMYIPEWSCGVSTGTILVDLKRNCFHAHAALSPPGNCSPIGEEFLDTAWMT